MRSFTPDFLDRYLAEAGPDLCQIVGAYEIEGRGIQLFERVEGDTSPSSACRLCRCWPSCRRRGVIAA